MIYFLLGYEWLFIHRPFEVWPVLGDYHLERIYMLVAIGVWALSGQIRWLPNSLHLAYAAFAVSVVVCWGLSPWSGTPNAQTEVENYFKLLVFYVMLVTTVRTENDLKVICLGFLASMGLYMAHSYREYLNGNLAFRMEINRMIGVDSSLGDPNSFAASILYALPFSIPAWFALKRFKARTILVLGYVGLSLLCIVLTGSRGAFVGLIVGAFLLIARSRMRSLLFSLAVLAFPLLWFLIPSSLQQRFYTVIDPSVGPANAQASAETRSEGLSVGFALWQESPLTGIGPGAWRPASHREIESHNLFGQVIGEMGTLGVLTFGSIVLLLGSNVRAIKRIYKERALPKDFLYFLADATGIAVILLLFLGYGAHSLFRFSWLWYGAFLVIARHCAEDRIKNTTFGLRGLSGTGRIPTVG